MFAERSITENQGIAAEHAVNTKRNTLGGKNSKNIDITQFEKLTPLNHFKMLLNTIRTYSFSFEQNCSKA